jgi:hypothetical protein
VPPLPSLRHSNVSTISRMRRCQANSLWVPLGYWDCSADVVGGERSVLNTALRNRQTVAGMSRLLCSEPLQRCEKNNPFSLLLPWYLVLPLTPASPPPALSFQCVGPGCRGHKLITQTLCARVVQRGHTQLNKQAPRETDMRTPQPREGGSQPG